MLAALLCVALQAPSVALDDLTRVKPGRSHRVTSSSPDPASNRDNVWVKPGETFVVADLKGSGVIRHMWFTFSEAAPNWLAKEGAANPAEIVLRCYWDGASEPAVEAPFGDFFAAGFGRRAAVHSTPIEVEGGDAYNCYWPMPFAKSARITLTNESTKPLAALYFNIDWTDDTFGADTGYFCAQYRQEFPTKLGGDYLILDAVGRGHYVGTVMSVRTRSPEWFGEGDERIYIDGETEPSIVGTGTEDYFLNAWGLEEGSFADFGVTELAGEWGHVGQRFCAYRWHLRDALRFQKSLRVTIEHFGWMSADETTTGKVEGFVEREDDFATVAFWYQHEPPKRFATLPPLSERVLPNLDHIIEGSALLANAKAEHGTLSLQAGFPWTGAGQLFFDAQSQEAEYTTSFELAEKERRYLVLAYTSSYDFGIYGIELDGEEVVGARDFYSPEVKLGEIGLGTLELDAGKHTLRVHCVGKNPESKGWKLGLDSVRLRERWPAKRTPPKTR